MSTESKSPIRTAREALGWSISRLARETGLTEKTIGRLERGESVPGLDTARNVADALGKRVDELWPEPQEASA